MGRVETESIPTRSAYSLEEVSPMTDRGVSNAVLVRSGGLLDICRAAMGARDVPMLLADVSRLIAQACGPDAAARIIDLDAPQPPGSIAADIVVSGVAYRRLIVECPSGTAGDAGVIESVASLLGPAIERLQAEGARDSAAQRLAMAQRLARLGSYDWEIATDTNRWSDELYRIYGTEPQSFNASYEKFLSFVHPDDRERVMAVHRDAFESGRPYHMEERIVRPDGEVRVLVSNGEVIRDDAGTPIRMTGICMDVTEQRQIEATSRRSSERFRALIESAPDAVLVFDYDGAILHANAQTEALFGYSRDELAAMTSGDLIPAGLRDRHEMLRRRFLSEPYGSAKTLLDSVVVRKDGTEAFVDVSMGLIQSDQGPLIASFCRDATARREAEHANQRLIQMGQRRRQALEINDNIVQGLVAGLAAIETGRVDLGSPTLQRTLQSARALMSDLLDDGRAPQPGELVRDEAVRSHMAHAPIADPPVNGPRPAPLRRRVVIADDSDDLRLLLRMILTRSDDFEVVGEAADGGAAIDVVAAQHPDVILLDLAMPKMDGLQAMPGIRSAWPQTKIVVLSGFDASRMRDTALQNGADAYVEKGSAMTGIAAVLSEICGTLLPAG